MAESLKLNDFFFFSESQKVFYSFFDHLLYLYSQITVLLNTSTASVLQFALGEFVHPDHIYIIKDKHHNNNFLTRLSCNIRLKPSLAFSKS